MLIVRKLVQFILGTTDAHIAHPHFLQLNTNNLIPVQIPAVRYTNIATIPMATADVTE